MNLKKAVELHKKKIEIDSALDSVYHDFVKSVIEKTETNEIMWKVFDKGESYYSVGYEVNLWFFIVKKVNPSPYLYYSLQANDKSSLIIIMPATIRTMDKFIELEHLLNQVAEEK